MGGATIVLLIVAAWREWRSRDDVRSPHPWLATAWAIAAAGQVVILARPISYRPLIVPADLLFCATAALALVAFLAPQRAEASRARRATDRAQEVMGGRAEIAAMISHEVRGPVSTIRGLAGTALSHYDRLTDDERRELLDLIEQESRRLLATVTQASTALKVDAATVSYDIRMHDFGNTVREGIAAADVGVHPLVVDLAEGQVALDMRWIVEAVRQLVDNAAKFSPPDTPIQVTTRIDDAAARRSRWSTRDPASRSNDARTCSTSTRTGGPTGTNRRPARAWASSSFAASSTVTTGRLSSWTRRVEVRCSASGYPGSLWRDSGRRIASGNAPHLR